MAQPTDDPTPTRSREQDVSGEAPTMGAVSTEAPPAVDDQSRYRLVRLLGRGGMGEVTLCRDTWLGRDVARKRATGGSVDRFVREARLQARLDHPAIVPLFEATALDGPTPYFTMRHVSGVSLRTLLDRLRAGDPDAKASWNRRRLLTELVRVAEAIAFAHDRGIIHRDIKPDNIMLGEYGAVYVLDWGIAKTDDEPPLTASAGDSREPTTAERLTREGASMGTLGYMAPEQLDDAMRVDPRADVYALGAVLFEILTLERLHTGNIEAILGSTIDGVDARASVRVPLADVAPELEAVCVKATARDRDARHADVRSFVAEIERFLDGDRDLERRRELAREHLVRAKARAEAAADGADETLARADAMREAMRALAFDPDNADARGFLARLLIEPPREIPAEVHARIRRDAGVQARRQAQLGLYSGLGWFAFMTCIVLMGVRDWYAIAGLVVAMTVVLTRAIRHARDEEHAMKGLLLTFAAICTILAVTTRWFGPFVLVPGVIAGVLSSFALHPRIRALPLIAIGLSAFTLPFAAELVGVLPRSYAFTGDVWITRASLTDLPPGWSELVLWAGSAAGVIIQALAMTKIRDSLAAAQQRLAVHAWQLDQLVPHTHA